MTTIRNLLLTGSSLASLALRQAPETAVQPEASDAEQIVAMYQQESGNECPLNSAQVENLMGKLDDEALSEMTPAQWVNAIDDEFDRIESGDEDEDEAEAKPAPVVDKATASELERHARSFSDNLKKVGYEDIAFDIQEADEKTKRGPALMLWRFMHGENAWSDDIWADIPDPDLSEKQARESGSNARYSRWSVKDGQRNRAKDWFEITITALPKGAALLDRIENLRIAGTDKASTKEQLAFQSWGKLRRESELNTCETRLRNMVRRLRTVVRLRNRIADCNSVRGVEAGMIPDHDDKGNSVGLTKAVSCLFIQNKGTEKKPGMPSPYKGEALTVATFLRLDPQSVIETGGGYDQLLETKNRGGNAPEDSDFAVPTTAEDFAAAINVIGHFTTDRANINAVNKWFAKLNDDEKLEAARNYESVYEKLSAVMTIMRPTIERADEVERQAAALRRKETGSALKKAS